MYGDPHIVTLDGHKYTFNGKGEYILIQTGGERFTLQGRMEQASTVNSTLARATVFTALAVRQNDSSTVEFRLEDELYLVIDGVEERLEDFDKKPYTNVVVKREANSSFSATFSSSGAFVEVRAVDGKVLPDYISTVIVSLPDNFQGKTSGLMGNYNGDTSDDLIPQSGGDPLQLNTSLETLHWDFGVTCELVAMIAECVYTYVCLNLSTACVMHVCMCLVCLFVSSMYMLHNLLILNDSPTKLLCVCRDNKQCGRKPLYI